MNLMKSLNSIQVSDWNRDLRIQEVEIGQQQNHY